MNPTPKLRLSPRFFIELYTFIYEWKKKHGQPPSLRDLYEFQFSEDKAKTITGTSVSVPDHYIKQMINLGMVERERIKKGRSTLKLLPPEKWNPIVRIEIKDGESWEL